MSVRHKIFCPHCGAFTGTRRIQGYDDRNDPGVAFNCTACNKTFNLSSESSANSDTWRMSVFFKNYKYHTCPFCGPGNKKPNILKRGISDKYKHEYRNPKFILHIFHRCPRCLKNFFLFSQDETSGSP
jgi:ribosomal protein S27AE